MKKLTALLIISIVLVSCGGGESNTSVDDLITGGNLEAIRAKRTEIKAQQTEIQAQLVKLDEAIQNLDPANNMALVTTQTINDTLFRHFIEVQGLSLIHISEPTRLDLASRMPSSA